MELDFSEQIKKLFASKAEKTCPDCGEPMSKCKCDTSKSKMHPDVEDEKDKKSEKGNPNAEKEEEINKAGKACAEHGQMNCAKCEAKWQDSKAKKDESKEDPKEEAGESKDEEDQEDAQDLKTKAKKKIKAYLQAKINKFNEQNDRQITFAQIEEVFDRGAQMFESAHRIGVSKTQWAFARVNSFLKLVSNQTVNSAYAKADSDILTENFTSTNFDFVDFGEIEFQLAKISIIEAGLTDTEKAIEISFSEDKKKVKL